jgi:predicted enzyme related to lactoylglutathione lyase
MGQPVVHFEVMGRDGPALQHFYSQLFGWNIKADNPMAYGVIEHSENHSTGGVGIGGGILGGMQPGQDGACFYVEVPDVDAALARAERLGGTRIMGPQQVEGGSLVFGHLLDPEGHHVGLMQAGTFGPPARIDPSAGRKGSPVVHFEIVGRDFGTLERFYSSLFGWSPDRDNPVGYGVITRDANLSSAGVGIGGGIMAATEDTGMAGYPGHTTWYVEVPDVEAALARAEKLGGTRVMGPAPVPGGPTLGQFNDPEGHLIGVVQAE